MRHHLIVPTAPQCSSHSAAVPSTCHSSEVHSGMVCSSCANMCPVAGVVLADAEGMAHAGLSLRPASCCGAGSRWPASHTSLPPNHRLPISHALCHSYPAKPRTFHGVCQAEAAKMRFVCLVWPSEAGVQHLAYHKGASALIANA